MKKQHLKPYPNQGEIIRAIANSINSKGNNRELDRFARDGDYDYHLRGRMIDKVIFQPIKEVVNYEVAEFVKNYLESFLKNYIHMIQSIPMDGVSRKESLLVLNDWCFSFQAAGFLLNFFKKFGGPHPVLLASVDKNSLEIVFQWIDEHIPDWKSLYQGLDKINKDQIQRWRIGKTLPLLKSVDEIWTQSESVEKPSENDYKIAKAYIILARVLDYFRESHSSERTFNKLRVHLWPGIQSFDLGHIISKFHIEHNQKYKSYTRNALFLSDSLKICKQTDQEIEERIRAQLDDTIKLQKKLDPEGLTSYFLEWMEGRWYLFSNKLKKALHFYKKAFESCLYCAGPNQKIIIKESLLIAAHLDDRPFLKRIKNQMISFELFHEIIDNSSSDINNARSRSKDSVVEDWEVNQWKNQFNHTFPPNCFFHNNYRKLDNKEKCGPWVVENQDDIKPDYANPDRKLNVGSTWKKQVPQLVWFTMIGKTDIIHKLLQKGARVNCLAEGGESPLLISIEKCISSNIGIPDDSCYKVIVNKSHKKSVVNTKTVKLKKTPLTSAIKTGQHEIVSRILEMGAEVDLPGTVENMTPLYLCIMQIAYLVTPQKIKQLYYNANNNPNNRQLDSIRRHMGGIWGVDLDDHIKTMGNLQKMNNFIEIINSVVDYSLNQTAKYISIENMIHIGSILIESGADPNAEHIHINKGYTPLMLAAELDNLALFKMMLENKGRPEKTCIIYGRPTDCRDIAMHFNSQNVLRFLEDQVSSLM